MRYLDKLSSEWTQKRVDSARRRWSAMKNRCYNPNDAAYKNYGGRGIKVCDRWLGEDGFYNCMVDMGTMPDGYSLDRIDNNKDYSPDNCRWATRNTQRANQRRVKESCLPNGISYYAKDKRKQKWLARLEVNGRRVLNKRCYTKEEAITARLAAEKEFL